MPPIKGKIIKLKFINELLFLALFLSSLMLAQSDTVKLSGKIKMNLNTEKTTFNKSETPRFELEIDNLLKTSLRIPKPSTMDELRITVIDKQGNLLLRGLVIDRLGYNTIELSPNEKWLELISLAGYGNDTSTDRNGNELVPGVYQLTAYLGDAKSNTITFDVIYPQGEEQMVRKKFFEARRSRNHSDEIAKLKELVTRYPHTAYLKGIYFQMLAALTFDNNKEINADKIMETAKELLVKFPNSPASSTALSYYEDGVKLKLGLYSKKMSEQETDTVNSDLFELKKAFPKSHAAKYIEQIIKR